MMGLTIEKLKSCADEMVWEKVESGFKTVEEALEYARENMPECPFRIVRVEWEGYLHNVGIGERKLRLAGIKKETFWGERTQCSARK